MKQIIKLVFITSFCFLLNTNLYAQAPQKFNYQGIARDEKGNPLMNQQLALKLAVLATSDASIAEFEETQLVTTNEFGLYTLQIGNGIPILGEMKNVKWEAGNKYIKVAIDPKGGANYLDAGTTQLLSVPYALYADKAGVAKESNGTRTGTVSSNAAHVAGDANYVTKFTGLNTIGKSLIYDNGTGIGVGTTTPAGLLHTKVTSGTSLITLENTNAAGQNRLNFQANGAANYCTIMKRGSGVSGIFGVATMPLANMFSFGNNGGPMVMSTQGNMGIAATISGAIQYKFLTDTLSGNVGLAGNAIPTARVHINNTQATNANLRITNNTTAHTINDGLEISTTGNAASIMNRENSTLTFGANNVPVLNLTSTGITELTGQIKVAGGAPGLGKVLTSDANGLATWQTPIGGGGGGQWTTSVNHIYNNNTANVGIGITLPTSKLHVIDASTTLTSGIIRGEYTGPNVLADVVGVYGKSLANTNYGIGVVGEGNYRGVLGISNSGIGVYAASATGAALYSNSTKGNAVRANSDSLTAGLFTSNASSGTALYEGVLKGEYTGPLSDAFVGVYGKNISSPSNGIGVQGVGGEIGVNAISTGAVGYGVYGTGGFSGIGVYGYSNSGVGTSGQSFNGIGVDAYSLNNFGLNAYSSHSIAVNANADSSNAGYFTSGNSFSSITLQDKGVLNGAYIGSSSQDAVGVTGISLAPSTTLTWGIGVRGIGNYIGVNGVSNGTLANSYAGYFNGSLFATAASSSIKTFKIDHPLDPQNKFLYHSSVESDDMMNIYNGNITTDANGDAIVELPTYFEALNIDYKYQLTVIGTFAQAIISEEVANNQFKIKTNQPNVKVSWQVTGVRNDAMAQAHRVEVEVVKTGKDKGKYLNPIEAGQPASDGIMVNEKRPSNQQKDENKVLRNIENKKPIEEQMRENDERIEKLKNSSASETAIPALRK